jgi:hypothetical protein
MGAKLKKGYLKVMKKNNNEKNNNLHQRAKGLAMFSGFKNILQIEQENSAPLIDPDTGKRRTWAHIGSVKIKES